MAVLSMCMMEALKKVEGTVFNLYLDRLGVGLGSQIDAHFFPLDFDEDRWPDCCLLSICVYGNVICEVTKLKKS